MKTLIHSMLAVGALALTTLIVSQPSVAQAPASAPAGSTGLCNDGSYWTGASKSGACRGHKGIKTWYAASGSAPTAAATPTPAPAPAAAPASVPASAPSAAAAPAPKSNKSMASATGAAKTPAPGGGPGMVWVNTASNVYHCSGTKYYGTTKAGAYMSEADAKAKGARPNGGKGCS